MKRLDKYCEEEPDNWRCVKVDTNDGEPVGKFYEAPRDLLKLQKRKRRISEEQRQASAERLAQYRKAAEQGEEQE